MTRHARLGPSSSEIWLACESAPSLWEQAPKGKPGFAASEGTLAHTLCEAALQINAIPWQEGAEFKVDGRVVTVTDEMLSAVSLYVTSVLTLRDMADWSLVEKEVDISWLWEAGPPEIIFGTTDFSAVVDDMLHVIDFKYGRGKSVQPQFNTQLSIYALGALGRLEDERPDLAGTIKTVRLTIIQPRTGGQPVRFWDIAVTDLLLWARKALVPAIERIVYGEPNPFSAGRHCYFCAGGVICPVLRAHKIANAVAELPDYKEEEIV